MNLIARRAFVSATAASIGLGIGHAMMFPHAHWAVITALTLLAPTADGTAKRTLWRVLGTAGSAVFVIALYGIRDPLPEFVIFFSLLALIVGYTWVHFANAQYAVLLFLPLGAGFALEALNDPAGAPALVGYRVFFIALGAILVMILSRLLRCQGAPTTPAPPLDIQQAVTHALRLTLGSILAMIFAALADRPDLAPMMVITILVLGSVTTAGARRDKAVLRFGGAAAGGGIAVGYSVWLLDMTTGILGLMTIVFVVTWFSAVVVGIRSISYLGIQTGFVFAWSIGDGPRAPGDIWVPLERIFQVGASTLLVMIVYRVRVPKVLIRRFTSPLRPAAPQP